MATDAHELQGLRALVTGGTKGIGRAIAARLRECGATVLTTARTARDDSSSGVDFVAADVATADGCRTVVDAVHRRLGGIDVIVHVVGGSSAPAGGFAVLDDRRMATRTRSESVRPRPLCCGQFALRRCGWCAPPGLSGRRSAWARHRRAEGYRASTDLSKEVATAPIPAAASERLFKGRVLRFAHGGSPASDRIAALEE